MIKIKSERERLESQLKVMKITERIFPSDANFLLVKVNNAAAIYTALVEKNIIVRNRTSVVKNCLRITVGTRSENNKLIKGLKSISI